MLWITYECGTIQEIGSQVDRYDKWQQLGPIVGADSDTAEPRVFLYSEVKRSLTVSAYHITLLEDLGIEDFITPLSNLLQGG